jgi:coronin-7
MLVTYNSWLLCTFIYYVYIDIYIFFLFQFWIHDLNVGSLNSFSNHIKASSDFIAFRHDSTSVGSLAVVPMGSYGRNQSFPTVSGHSGLVTDFDFSPFDDALLCTGSEDSTVKLWSIPSEGISGSLSEPKATFGPVEKRIESVLFHPAADNVFAMSSGTSIEVLDLEELSVKISLGGNEDTVQNMSWKGDGSMLCSVCKDGNGKKIRVWDPRAESAAMDVKAHSGLKESQVQWLEDEYIASSGFSASRESQVLLWDTRNFAKSVASQSFGNTVGSPMLFYDEDTKMLFVAVRGESNILFFELTEKSPFLSPGGNMYRSDLQQKGLAMAPKRSCDVMNCQVARFFQLTKNAVVPVGAYVQRKSHREFHEDLFPESKSNIPAMTAKQWFDGANDKVGKMSLDPARPPRKTEGAPKKKPEEKNVAPSPSTPSSQTSSDGNTTPSKQKDSQPQQQPKQQQQQEEESEEPKRPVNPKVLNLVRSSKFRHIEGSIAHKSTHIESMPDLNRTIPGDSNAFSCNSKLMAVAPNMPGGQIAIIQTDKPCRLPNSIPTLQNVAAVMDFSFDPFNSNRLIVATDDCNIRVWDIPEGGLREKLEEPSFKLVGHEEKCNVLLFHPLASSLLTSAGYDGSVFIWDLENREVAITLDPLPEPLYAMAWSQDGARLATVAKDQRIRIYEPRKSTSPIAEGCGPEGTRGARVVWVDSDHIVISGFTKTSARQLLLHDINKLDVVKSSVELNISPATLIPHYDQDTKVIFLAGKGDNNIPAFEYAADEAPYLFQVAGLQSTYPHQAVAFLHKTACDVRKVEIARAIRLCKSSAEPISFKVPRVRSEFFQDDVFLDTAVVWEPVLTGKEWLEGKNGQPRTISLKPDGMTPLSQAPKPKAAPKKFESFNPNFKTDAEKKEELIAAMLDKLTEHEDPLPQDGMEGVDDDEWDDY